MSERRTSARRKAVAEAEVAEVDQSVAPSSAAVDSPSSPPRKKARRVAPTAAAAEAEEAEAVSHAATKKKATPGGAKSKAKQKKKQSSVAAAASGEVADDSAPAAAAAATATSSPSTHLAANISRTAVFTCDSNSLSVVFSFLNAAEFHASLRVSQQWRAVSGLNTSWPQFDLARFIDTLQAENYDDPTQRRVRVEPAQLPRLQTSAIYRKTNDLVLGAERLAETQKLWDRAVRAETTSMETVSQLPHLTALNVTLRHVLPDALASVIAPLAGRLRVLIVSNGDDFPLETTRHSWAKPAGAPCAFPIASLTQLRVLVLDALPSKVFDLVALTQLECLHIANHHPIQPSLMLTVRILSGSYQLRSFSYSRTNNARVHSRMASVTSPIWLTAPTTLAQAFRHGIYHPSPSAAQDETPVPPSSLTDLSLLGELWTLAKSFDSACQCPLERLRFSQPVAFLAPNGFTPASEDTLRRLKMLQLQITRGHDFVRDVRNPVPRIPVTRILSLCHSLRQLHLDYHSDDECIHGLLLVSAFPDSTLAGLEELTIGRGLAFEQEEEIAMTIAKCHQLRRLDLNHPTFPLHTLIPVLTDLPHFACLELTLFYHPDPPPLPAELMSAVARSASWNLFHLHLSTWDHSDSHRARQVVSSAPIEHKWKIANSDATLQQGGVVDAQTAARFRLHVHAANGGEIREYVVGTTARSPKQRWCEIK